MRSWPSLLLVLAACGTDTDAQCASSQLTYDNFGAPFVTNWCRSCHSASLIPSMRQDAPTDVNFDTLDEVRTWSRRISLTAGTTSDMPPAGGPTADERKLLVEWLRCGAP